MKKICAAAVLAVLFTLSARACPICGCGGGNLYLGLLPDFQYQFVGIRYNYAQYHTQLVSDPSQFSTNYYNSIELWGGVHIGKRFQVLAFVPYYINKQIDDDGTTNPKGLGDITVMGQYKIFGHLGGTRARQVEQQLWLGLGVKLPTGAFDASPTDSATTIADINAQLGTGSTDFILNGLYSVRIGKFGVNTAVNYKINTLNSDNYKYGNKFSGTLLGYYRINLNQKAIIAPNIGMGYENVAANQNQKVSVQFTGSNVTSAIVGLEFDFNKISIGVNGQIPVSQNFAEGQTKLKFRGMMHVTFAI